jgi:hypothetical protein
MPLPVRRRLVWSALKQGRIGKALDLIMGA